VPPPRTKDAVGFRDRARRIWHVLEDVTRQDHIERVGREVRVLYVDVEDAVTALAAAEARLKVLGRHVAGPDVARECVVERALRLQVPERELSRQPRNAAKRGALACETREQGDRELPLAIETAHERQITSSRRLSDRTRKTATRSHTGQKPGIRPRRIAIRSHSGWRAGGSGQIEVITHPPFSTRQRTLSRIVNVRAEWGSDGAPSSPRPRALHVNAAVVTLSELVDTPRGAS
jgi:hypothetical protein